ncbi:L-2-amino-thiazoline-4-carboxylic acid hydrolase [Paradesulfitobacterium ferrireducens]|uniref:L-2-amino-thiazoline-4-carboxylic acid hydrolase n=1 Tax=Paradesulfitobacterium ferrireducens TaxID=2816476 RepID=UPI001A8E5E98|nr:L-2-amino-thiazoline-4-carboxylic acid hydrolase [Paradesulfitobacterium ferrireducens]
MSLNSEDAYKRLEKDWRSMIFIAHDFFHRWRQVVEEKYGKEEAEGLILRFWELVGQGTGESYLKRGRDTENLEQVVKAMLRASEVMGEQARMEADGNDYLLIHDACPWIDSFKSYGAPGECQAGCDHWFGTAVKVVSPNLNVVTESCLAAGDSACVRRYSKRS